MTMRDKLSAGAPTFGTFVFSPDAAHTEIVAHAGFDFVVIDTEHAPLGALQVTDHVRAAQAAGTTPIVRVRGNRPEDVGRLLDTGAAGVMLPHVGLDPVATRAALAATKYSPDGDRPTCTAVRAIDYGLADFVTRSGQSNREVLTIGLVEDAAAVDRIEQVLEETPFDVIIPGAGDLASSYGVPGQLTHELVTTAVDRVITAAQRSGTRAGLYVRDAREAERWADSGVSVFLASIDYRILARAYQDMRAELTALTEKVEATV